MYWNNIKDVFIEPYKKININMRCIEITIYDPYDLECSLININMRCIEIINGSCNHIYVSGLTLTWDVLKS